MITSSSNPKIKNFRLLQKASERREQGLFVLEGLKEVEKALMSGIQIETAFHCPEIIPKKEVDEILFKSVNQPELLEVSSKVYTQIAYRENSDGLIVWAKPVFKKLDELEIRENPLILVLESVEKPGNLGAILRTADAAGVDAVIVCDQQTDLYNPNVVRSSIGCIFSVQTVVTSSSDAIKWLQASEIDIYCAALSASKPYSEVDFKRSAAIVLGSESTGLSEVWLEKSTQNIIIPMHGLADSMNVSVSTAVIVFEAVRQRGAKFEKP